MDLINSDLPSVSIDIDAKAKNMISQKQSVKQYASRIFQESTIGIVSSIVATHSKYRRFFKICLSSLCITGFLYQCVTFLNHVFEYPTVINIAVDRSTTYSKPAYTFCNNNVIRRSVFCKIYPDHCIEPSEEFCKKFSSYCGANKTLIPMEKYYAVENAMTYANILKYGGNATDFFLLDRYRKDNIRAYQNPSGPYLRNNHGITTKMICYSLNSVVENNQQPLRKRRINLSYHYPTEVLTFYVNETEMMNPTSKPGVLLSVHSPFEFVNPFERGIFLQGGRTYKIFSERQEEILLKDPFETNCVDYEELWKKNNHSGPRTQKMCQEKCSLDKYLLEYQCARYTILYPSNERMCEQNFSANSTRDELTRVRKGIAKCQKSCRDNCRLLKYTTEVSVRYQVDFIKDENPHRYIIVEIYLSDDVSKVLSHSPKYMTVEVFSSIGGFLGCWLGITLLDIFDVFGSMLTVCRYAFRRRL